MPNQMLLFKYNGTFAENAGEAGKVTLIGMVTIFVVLAALWGAIELLHFVMSKAAKRSERKAAKTEVAPSAAEEPTAAPEELVPASDDGAVIAAITAAIMAARAEEGVTTGFRVVSFRRANAVRKRG